MSSEVETSLTIRERSEEAKKQKEIHPASGGSE